jgi:DNA-binding CsgD family transcriptional regulator
MNTILHQVAELHDQITRSNKARRIPAKLREDWSQQVYAELLELAQDYSRRNRDYVPDFPTFAWANIFKRLRRWWAKQNEWRESVVLVPEHDPNLVDTRAVRVEPADLDETEQRVWDLLVAGYNAKEIAPLIGKSHVMVRAILQRIYEKQRTVHRGGETT